MAKSKNRSSNSSAAAHSGRSAAPRGQHHGASDDYAAPRRSHGSGDEFGGAIKLAFRDHNWPASRKALLEHARHNTALGKNEIARLEQIPDRKYKSVVDLVNATSETSQPRTAAAAQQQQRQDMRPDMKSDMRPDRPERPERQEMHQEVGQVTTAASNRRAAGQTPNSGQAPKEHPEQYQQQQYPSSAR
jgi:hypothetical protein